MFHLRFFPLIFNIADGVSPLLAQNVNKTLRSGRELAVYLLVNHQHNATCTTHSFLTAMCSCEMFFKAYANLLTEIAGRSFGLFLQFSLFKF